MTIPKRAVGSLCLLLLLTAFSHAELLTIEYEGRFNSTSLLFNAGDTFFGSYTLETTTPTTPHSDSSLNVQATAIASLSSPPSITPIPGTEWTLNVDSSLIAPFTVVGTFGGIAVGNDTSFGDRYIATLNSFPNNGLPGGLSLNFFQIDLQANGAAAGMLTSDSLAEVPDLSQATAGGGRFFIDNPSSGCSQCQVTIKSIRAVPEPSGKIVFALSTCLVLCLRRRRLV